MADYPALPLWTDAYLADCSHLSDAEHGRYLRLLMEMWRTPGCRLPNDDEWLARKFSRSVEDVQRELRPLLREFFNSDGHWLRQKRLTREHEYIENLSAAQSKRAKARWDKGKGASPNDALAPKSRRGVASNRRKSRKRLANFDPTHTHTTNRRTLDDSPRTHANGELFDLPSPKHEANGAAHDSERRRLPADWRPTEAEAEFARSHSLDPDAVTDGYVLYWTEGNGQETERTREGWRRTWRNWCRNDAKRLGASSGSRSSAARPSTRSAATGGIVGAALRARARRDHD